MKFYVVTDQGVDYICKPLSELLTSQGINIHLCCVEKNRLWLWVKDNYFLEFLQKHSTLKNAMQYIRYGTCSIYNLRVGSTTEPTISWFDYPEGGDGKWGFEYEKFHIEFTEEEHKLLKKIFKKMWKEVLYFRLSYFFSEIRARFTSGKMIE